MSRLPLPKAPRDRTDLIVFLSVLTVAACLAMVGRLTSAGVTTMTAMVVGLLAAWSHFRRPPPPSGLAGSQQFGTYHGRLPDRVAYIITYLDMSDLQTWLAGVA